MYNPSLMRYREAFAMRQEVDISAGSAGRKTGARTVTLDFCRRIFGPVSVKRSGLRAWSPSRRFTTPAVLASAAPRETIPKRDGAGPWQSVRKSGRVAEGVS